MHIKRLNLILIQIFETKGPYGICVSFDTTFTSCPSTYKAAIMSVHCTNSPTGPPFPASSIIQG